MVAIKGNLDKTIPCVLHKPLLVPFWSSSCNLFMQVTIRAISTSPSLNTKGWRLSQDLPLYRNSEGILTDGPDYTFLDGRPTPLLHKQKKRLLKQREYASQIVELCAELDFAKDRHQKILAEKEIERQRILSNRLKPKGRALKRQ